MRRHNYSWLIRWASHVASLATDLIHWASQARTTPQTYSTKRDGGSIGCCGFIPRRSSFITRSQMTEIIRVGVSRKTKLLITGGGRAVFASSILQTGNGRACVNIRAIQTASRILPDDTRQLWLLASRFSVSTLTRATMPTCCYARGVKFIYWARQKKASSKVIHMARRIDTPKLPGPTIWNGARRNFFARPTSAGI